ncbi:MAG: type VI secretion system baseplate subunit TssE [Gemmatimonadales bacterium]
MAKTSIERVVQLSVLDRLLDDEPRSGVEASLTRAQSILLLRAAVARDLDALLNTRRTPEPAPEELEEVRASVYHYGMPDLSSLSQDALNDRSRLVQMLEETVALFEPRLTDVKVVVAPAEEHSPRVLRFRIEALLRMDPQPERIAFDTRVEVNTGRYALEGTAGA